MTKPDNRKRIPIPNDIQPGDVLVLRDGQHREFITRDRHGNARVYGGLPSALNSDGRWYARKANLDSKCHEWDVIAIARRLNGGKGVAIIAIATLALAGCATDPQPVPGAPEVIRPAYWPATVTTMPDGNRLVTVSHGEVPRVIVLLPPVAAEGKGVKP